MLVSYPALFFFDDSDGLEASYQVYIPDLDAMTQGRDISDSIFMASDLLGIRLADDIENERSIAEPSDINSLSLVKNRPFQDDDDFKFTFNAAKSFISMVSVELDEYLSANEPIKKTLTIPKWADKLGKELHLNFSKTLTDAIVEKKIGA
ncbi:type II toxin-antitoxin system HicB family antitoxin [Enterococcus hulanensis]|uniref:type II toxin-antitoxin system HicB family antitoxin n=1 Tax=Enterococcus hulanensis TaxID=2559929 RepID=UPI0010F4C6F1|nr:type II toxin-antitoxin system HicB family antitoxin [Enterococcus hulanensis]MDT2659123.1 type II toxin-antitoxin system HicB family antitoxin [Enterococcus hulanensis]